MEVNTYRYLTPVEIVEYLCQGSANGFSEDALKALEKKLGLFLPKVLREFLLRAGRERICAGENEIFPLDFFQVREGYLVIGKRDGRNLNGIWLEDITMEEGHSMEEGLSMDNPPVYVRDAQGKWDVFAESIEDYLLAELDRRIRKTKISDQLNDDKEYLERYFYCGYLLCEELTLCMYSSEIFVPEETWDDIFPEKEQDEGEDWEDEEDWEEEESEEEDWEEEDSYGNGRMRQHPLMKHWACPQELKNMLMEKKVSLPAKPYAIAVCLEEQTGILYSACFPKDEQRFVSLLQINEPRAASLQNSISAPEQYYAERLLDQLAEEVHAPVMAHCLAKESMLPETVRKLADEELHRWIADTIGNFLKLFENNRSWKLGVCAGDKFIECSGIDKRRESESLLNLWYGHHLKAEPPLWTPSFMRKTKEKEGEKAPEELEPFLKELIYRVHDYNLLNRYAFLARKIVTKGGFSSRTQNYTEEERFALLSFYREMTDGVTERIFDCLERKVFSIRIKGRDFNSLCGGPMAHMEGWIYQYERDELRFLEEGCWR